MSEDEFNRKNERRLDLLDKKHGGFTEEESNRRFDEHPGWKEECERRYQKNLTDEERSELARLNAEVDAYLNERYPLPDLSEPEERAKRLGNS